MDRLEKKHAQVSPRTRSTTTTDGIEVTVQSEFLPRHSEPADERFVFAYSVRIRNVGATVAQLRTRHWVITHGNGETEEVRGPGVIGEEPVLEPGESFSYASGAVLKTPVGCMHGSYQMERADGVMFDAEIAPFSLEMPFALN